MFVGDIRADIFYSSSKRRLNFLGDYLNSLEMGNDTCKQVVEVKKLTNEDMNSSFGFNREPPLHYYVFDPSRRKCCKRDRGGENRQGE